MNNLFWKPESWGTSLSPSSTCESEGRTHHRPKFHVHAVWSLLQAVHRNNNALAQVSGKARLRVAQALRRLTFRFRNMANRVHVKGYVRLPESDIPTHVLPLSTRFCLCLLTFCLLEACTLPAYVVVLFFNGLQVEPAVAIAAINPPFSMSRMTHWWLWKPPVRHRRLSPLG